MEPPGAGIWSKIPGYDGIDDSEEEHDEVEIKATAKERLAEIVGLLGEHWVETSYVKFAPPPAPGDLKDQTRCRTPLPSRRWGPNGLPPCFKLEHTDATIVRETFLCNGFVPTTERDWVVMWSSPSMRDTAYSGLHEYQRVNHFPGSTELTRKDRMWRNLQEKAKVLGQGTFDFVPETFVLPAQLEEFLDCYRKNDNLWIVKPHASSRGRGIFILRDSAELPMDELSVVSRYVDNPLLIQGLKFDLRVYVLVTGFQPLRAYVYREGLTRFASSPYSTNAQHLQDAYRHLTNYSINKSAHNFVENVEAKHDNVGHKWSLSALNKHLQCVGVDVELMWARINDMIVKTLLAVEPAISSKTRELSIHPSNCFEVYGFDVLVDENLKPWLLEVNLSPSMQAESPLDWQVKTSLLSDAFNLVGVCNADQETITMSRLRAKMMQIRRSNFGLRHQQSPLGYGVAKPRQRSSLFGNQTPDELHAVAEAAELLTKGVVLDSLSEEQLKMLANALLEIGRRRNFIRLYPTRATARRYAPLVEQTHQLSRTQTLNSFGCHHLVKSGGSRHSASQLLASLLFGPAPTRAPLRSRSGALPRRGSSSPCRGAVGFSRFNGVESTEATKASVGRSMQRLLFMEYLVRVSVACTSLNFNDKARICQNPSSARLLGFHRQLKRFRSREMLEDDVEPERDDGGLVDELEDLCTVSLEVLAKEIWETEADCEEQALRPKDFADDVATRKLESFLPPTFAAKAESQKALKNIARLTAADLERALSAPAFAAEFRLNLGTSDRNAEELQAGTHVASISVAGEGSRLPRRRPLSCSSYSSRHAIEDRRRTTTSILNDLLRVGADAAAPSDPISSGGPPRPVVPQTPSQRRRVPDASPSAAQAVDSSSPRSPGFAGSVGSATPSRTAMSASRPRSCLRAPSGSRGMQPLDPPSHTSTAEQSSQVVPSCQLSHTRSAPSLVECKVEACTPLRYRSSRSLKMSTSVAATGSTLKQNSMFVGPGVAESLWNPAVSVAPDFLADIEL